MELGETLHVGGGEETELEVRDLLGGGGFGEEALLECWLGERHRVQDTMIRIEEEQSQGVLLS